MKKIKVFMHLIDSVPGFEKSADEIIASILQSGLVEVASEINIYHQYSLNPKKFAWLREKLSSYKNIKFILGSGFPEDYEFPTVMEVRKSAIEDTEEFYALYLHHKGVTRPDVDPDADFRRLLLYFNVEKWKECVLALDRGYDVAGVNWYNAVNAWHFPGNFWWANSSYIKKLPELQMPHIIGRQRQLSVGAFGDDWYRSEAEIWIGLESPRAYSIYNFPSGFAPGWTKIEPVEYRD